MTTATITWHPASEPPEHGRSVLVAPKSNGVHEGYFSAMAGWWCDMADDGRIDDVQYWAEMPAHPEAK